MNAEITPIDSFLTRKLAFRLTPAVVFLILIMLLSTGLHFYQIDAIGDANAYYTASVKSMLQSWHNFFFVAAEPGGSVTVDKPPLGLWIEALFAALLGVSGLSVSLPNILSGIFSLPLLYLLVKKHLGALAGLTASLVLAVTPVVLATDRNNTMEGMLVFVLLLAAWAFIRATETGKLRWLMLGAFFVGVGFNIKMLQAFLPLPVFYGLYLLGARPGWGKKIANLLLASLLLLVVSLSWAVAVDLTPADQRPYIGSSEDNTVMELIVGHNALSRLFNPRLAGLQGIPSQPRQNVRPPVAGVPRQQPGPGFPPAAPQQPGLQGGSTPFSQETGSPGWLRFFQAPLSKQMSWLLPFALVSLFVLAFAGRTRLPLVEQSHQAFLLWGGWLLSSLLFFSFVEGIFHAYYVIMLTPPLAAVVGGGYASLYRMQPIHPRLGALLFASAAGTLAFQFYTAGEYGVWSPWLVIAPFLLVAGFGLYFLKPARQFGSLAVLLAMLVIPFYWSVMTVSVSSPNVNLPTAYEGSLSTRPGQPSIVQPGRDAANDALLDYLQVNTQDVEYLVAVSSARTGAPLVLATGRPVLYMGGFSGNDPVIDAERLAEMVVDVRLRYVLHSGGSDQQMTSWLQSACRPVPRFSRQQLASPQSPRPGQANSPAQVLYECGQISIE